MSKEKKAALRKAFPRKYPSAIEKEERRLQRRAERRCFWTYPFGHHYRWEAGGGLGDHLVCVHCGRRDLGADVGY